MTDSKSPWTEEQRALLDMLLDQLIPASPNGKLPPASQLGVADFLAARVEDTRDLGELLEKGLATAKSIVDEKSSQGVAGLSAEDREAIFYELQGREPEFFNAFNKQSSMGYYTHPMVPPAFGLPDRPPQPLGHKVPPNENLDELVAPVTARGKIWRDA